MAQLRAIVAIFLSLCLFASSVQGKATKVTYCDKKGNYDVKVEGVEISPYPVARGKPATFSISATSGEKITGGKIEIDVSYFGLHVHSETQDLCSGTTSCPISAGDFVISHSQVLPGFTPPGSYTLRMRIFDENKHQLTCIGFQFSIGFGSASDVASI
uniref:MD-2-related lipid-recognition domain-containing protein n=1 Tax=Kalanchoe fedtschenkoi TaxID=63787 RepID=A0A7N0RGP9_KALFE